MWVNNIKYLKIRGRYQIKDFLITNVIKHKYLAKLSHNDIIFVGKIK